MNTLVCLLIASIPVFSKTATQVVSAVRPSETAWLIDDVMAPLMTGAYSVLFILSALLSLVTDIPSSVSLGATFGLILSAALSALFGESFADSNSKEKKP